MKRIITFFLFIGSLSLAVVAGLAWLNNILVVRLWYLDLNSVASKIVPTAEKIYLGPIGWLNWTAVDLSTISTFIPLFGLMLITFGFWRILIGKKDFSEDFPFFRSYDRISVSLGLIGTLWGIILIGYYPIETIKMSVLMLCLHTALFSTLVAVAWVFIVVLMIVKPFMAWWSMVVAGGPGKQTGEDLITVLENLQTAAAGAGGELAINHEQLKEFNSALEQGQTNLATMSSELSGCLAGINDAVKTTLEEATELRKERMAQGELITQTAAIIDKINATQNDIVLRLEAMETANSELKLTNQTLVAEKVELTTQLTQAENIAAATKDTLTKIKKALN